MLLIYTVITLLSINTLIIYLNKYFSKISYRVCEKDDPCGMTTTIFRPPLGYVRPDGTPWLSPEEFIDYAEDIIFDDIKNGRPVFNLLQPNITILVDFEGGAIEMCNTTEVNKFKVKQNGSDSYINRTSSY